MYISFFNIFYSSNVKNDICTTFLMHLSKISYFWYRHVLYQVDKWILFLDYLISKIYVSIIRNASGRCNFIILQILYVYLINYRCISIYLITDMVTTTELFFSLSIKSNLCRVFIVCLYVLSLEIQISRKGLRPH